MKKINLLLTNVGRKIYFLNFIKKINSDIKIHVSDCDANNAAFAFDKNIKKYCEVCNNPTDTQICYNCWMYKFNYPSSK